MRRREELEEQRDLRLRDLLDLDARVEAGELTSQEAAALRARDEHAAVVALTALEQLDEHPEGPGERRSGGERSKVPRFVVLAGVVALLVAVGVTLAGAIVDRPPGGFVTGNELSAAGEQAPDAREVPIDVLADVVRRNPDVVGMRLELADRLFREERYAEAAEQYLDVLQRDPEPRALVRLAWLVAQDGRIETAIELADAALERAPRDVEATWVRAELAEAAGDDELARQLFRQLTTEFDLDPTARTEIDARLEQLGSEPGERR